MSRTLILACVVVLCLLFVTACAPGLNPARNTAPEQGRVAGFWQGLWHGLIVVITFIVSLFNPRVGIYEVHNNGLWYNLGFLLGAACALGGSGRASHRR